MFESEADRLAMVQAVGGEEFDTGRPTSLLGVFDREAEQNFVGDHVVETRVPTLTCRSSDVAAHDLKKGSAITRVSDGSAFRVQRLEDDGSGMTTIRLTK
jgi:hypothetical protein